jgi:hypothetical protein
MVRVEIALDFVDAIANPSHPEHQAMLDWHGGPFDPAAINPDAIDRRLQQFKL